MVWMISRKIEQRNQWTYIYTHCASWRYVKTDLIIFLQVLGQIASIEISELDQDVGNSLYQASYTASTVVCRTSAYTMLTFHNCVCRLKFDWVRLWQRREWKRSLREWLGTWIVASWRELSCWTGRREEPCSTSDVHVAALYLYTQSPVYFCIWHKACSTYSIDNTVACTLSIHRVPDHLEMLLWVSLKLCSMCSLLLHFRLVSSWRAFLCCKNSSIETAFQWRLCPHGLHWGVH